MRSTLISYALLLTLACMATPAYSDQQHDSHSPYAGQEQRTIKSLSDDDINQLQAGKGWGLAKAAELNGMPGPAHVLEMKDKIGLTPEQTQQVQNLFNNMQSRAIPLGKHLVDLERKLNASFADRTITGQELKQQLENIYRVYSELRYVHLITHLQTPALLTDEQVSLYNQLRGYSSGDPCKHIPQGHNAEMWKKHNACS